MALLTYYELFRIARIDAGLTQKDVAKLIGTKQSNISAFENGKLSVSVDYFLAMVEKIGYKLKFDFCKL